MTLQQHFNAYSDKGAYVKLKRLVS